MKNIYKALALFQQECPIIHKDTQGFGYTYADLPKIFSIIIPLLKKHGLGFTQLIQSEGIITTLFHVESGETLTSSTPIPVVQLAKMNEYQAFGSGVTYYRRYALSSMLGIVTDKDTDGAGEQIKEQVKEQPKVEKWMSEKQFNGIKELILSENIEEHESGLRNFEAFKTLPYGMKKDYMDEFQTMLINLRNKHK